MVPENRAAERRGAPTVLINSNYEERGARGEIEYSKRR